MVTANEDQRSLGMILHHLDEWGFVIVPQVLSREIVAELIEHLQAKLDQPDGPRSHAIRHLVEAVPVVRTVAESTNVRSLAESVLGQKTFLVRSLFFDKTPEANWKVAWHQDRTITVKQRIEAPGFRAWSIKDGVTHVQPPADVLERMLTVRLHLDDCAGLNGPLQVIAGSHREGLLSARQISDWRQWHHPTTCHVSSGGALVMRPLLLHASSPACQPKHRRVIHLEFAIQSLPYGLQWCAANL